MPANLIEFTDVGLYVPEAKVYIDPWRAVNKAIITHGHSDHARIGHKWYMTHKQNVAILKHRLGANINVSSVEFGEVFTINGVKFSLHPAGHVLGSSQVRVEHKGRVWVFSGDYKTANDGISGMFEPVKCHAFITESTFGMPVFNWKPQQEIFDDINRWWNKNKEDGKVSLISAYSLGKAQRIIANVDSSIGPIFTHGAVEPINEIYRAEGVALPPTTKAGAEHTSKDFKGALVVAPGSAFNTPWANKFKPTSTAVASGWMNLRGAKRWQATDRGFVLSDHADWTGLISAIKGTGCESVYITHGYTSVFSRWLQEHGYDAHEVKTLYGEENEAPEVIEASPEKT
jgi:putative mRNA 3-end processing factor